MATMTTRFRGGRLLAVAGALGLGGLSLTALGLAVAPARALFAWLAAFTFVASVALGALCFLLIVHAAASTWPVAVRRLTEAVAGTFPLLALAFVPVVVGAAHIYPWAHPEAVEDPHLRHLIAHKAPYLNVPFFALRGAFYLAVWIAVSALLRRWSFAADESAPSRQQQARALSAAALPLVGLTLTFAAFDWLMSLEPAWFSSVFGIYWFAGGFVASLALLAALAEAARRGPLAAAITTSHFHALGRLVFAFSIFWAYIAYFQALLIQIANKPEEVTFYLHRIEGGWAAVAWLLAGGRFAVPFLLLLPRATKCMPRLMAALGLFLVVTHYLDCYWLVMPLAPTRHVWIDLAALVGLTGTAVAFAAWRLRGHALLPLGDPRLEEALAYRSPL